MNVVCAKKNLMRRRSRMAVQEGKGTGRIGPGGPISIRTGKGAVLFIFIISLVLLIFNLDLQPISGADTACDCNFCHGDQHGANWQGCSGCHESPPQTASHQKHYGTGPLMYVRYGDTGITQDFNSYSGYYQIGCGNCHPIDKTKHRNGILEVELYDAGSPAASLKARNLSSAAYAPGGMVTTYTLNGFTFSYSNGTCNGVYCHSYVSTSSGDVAPPLKSGSTYILDETCNFTYAPYTVTRTTQYRIVTWGDSLTCSGCHGNPTTTSFPGVRAGVGDSHQWIDDYGYGNLHMYNMSASPVSCTYCHNDTVLELNTWSRNGMDVTTMGDVPVYNYSKHVNGAVDVAFDRINPFPHITSDLSLANATYDPQTKSCYNVACHYNGTSRKQKVVTWGKPYRWWTAECDSCHRYGYYGNIPACTPR
jgi:predicted CxxxxCH...CXXCH cytochrome family protein